MRDIQSPLIRPRVPVLPVLSLAGFLPMKGSHAVPNLLSLPHFLHTTRGATAISLALQHAGIRTGDSVLLPAYHCLTMVSPVTDIGARPVFYPIQPDLTASLSAIESRWDESCKAILIAHFFGYVRDLTGIRQFCESSGLTLIEDCAHAFFGSVHGKSVGTFGDYAIGSTRKFFPVPEGGILASSRRTLDSIAMVRPSVASQLRSVLQILEATANYRRSSLVFRSLTWFMRLKDFVLRLLKRLRNGKGTNAIVATTATAFAGMGNTLTTSSTISRLILRYYSRSRIVVRRRVNYDFLHRAFSSATGARPLFSQLPIECVPYMFPLLVDNPDFVFKKLKREGIPLYRWETLATSECAISNVYSKALFQIPCHEALHRDDLKWIANRIVEYAGQAATKA